MEKTRIGPGTPLDKKLKKQKSSPLKKLTSLRDILKRPGLTYKMVAPYDGGLKKLPDAVIDQVEYEIKYEGFVQRQLKDIERFRHIENIKIPADFNYDGIPSLSIEIRQKLKKFAPASLGQANRISGVTPAAISLLMVYLKKKSLEKSRSS